VDDNCDGTVDNNVAGAVDVYETNNACSSSRNLGTVAETNSEMSWTATIYPSGDVDYFRFYAEEGSHTCFPGTNQTYQVRVRLRPPQSPNCVDYDLYLYNDSCASAGSSTNGSCNNETITFTWSGTCGTDDSRYFRVRVQPFSGVSECVTYTFYADMLML